MAQRFDSISAKHQTFIESQKIFFVATAGAEGRINLSPKGMDSLRVVGENRVLWLNVTGNGNETATHVAENQRMTLMFTAFEGAPDIMRLYGKARAIHQGDAEWQALYSQFTPLPGARQIFDLEVDLVQTSCGMAVPYYDYVGDRDNLKKWADKQGEEGIQAYWEKKNQTSLDGIETGILEKSRRED